MVLGSVLDERVLAAALVVLAVFLVLYITFSGFSMVGITPMEVVLLLFISPFLAVINIPVWTMPGVVVGVNAAGLGVPLFLSIRFLTKDRLSVWKVLVGTAAVGAIAYQVTGVAPEKGLLVPALPLVAVTAVVGIALAGRAWQQVGPTTYASGALGVIVGADLLHLAELADPSRSEPMFAVIGGAGTLDAIYLISLWAVLGTIVTTAIARLLGAGSSD